MVKLGSIVTAMITPFEENGALHLGEAKRLARWLVKRGNDGLVVAGSTGEGMALDDRERSALVSAVKESVGGDACVIANAGTNETRGSIEAARAMEAAGADALLSVVPYYNRPPQSGLLAHFGAIAKATKLPIILYNVPGRTATNMLPTTLIELARRHENIVGVKESSGDLKQFATILRDRPSGFTFFVGDDHLFLPGLSLGADGIVGVASHLCSREFAMMRDAFRGGRLDDAAALHLQLLGLFELLFATSSPIPIKWAMAQLGFDVGACRLPLDGMPEELAHRLKPLLASFQP